MGGVVLELLAKIVHVHLNINKWKTFASIEGKFFEALAVFAAFCSSLWHIVTT